MRMYRHRYALALCALVCGTQAGAETAQMEEITVKGSQVSSQTEVLTPREVRESPARDIGEALKQTEAIEIVRKGAIANDVVLRGQQKDNINVFLDDMRLHGACPSRMDSPAFHFDFAQVEEIEVVKGPYDLTSPGGIGGSVKAVSKSAEPGPGADLSLTAGSYDMVNGSATAWYGAKGYDLLGGYAYKYSDVPESGDGRKITQIYPGTSPNRYRPEAVDSRAYEIQTGWVKLGVAPTSSGRGELSYSYQDAEHILYPYLLMDADYDKTHQLNLSYRLKNISPSVKEVKLQLYWDQVRHLMDDKLRASSLARPRFYSMQTDAETMVYGVKGSGKMVAGAGTLTAGADYYFRNWDATNRTAASGYQDLVMIPDVGTDNIGIHAGYELPVTGSLRLKGGLRGDLTVIDAERPTNKVDSNTSFATWAGNLQALWKPSDSVEVVAGVGTGVRPPDAQELYINSPRQQGNPFLDPSRNTELDLGVKYATEGFFLKASLFNSFLNDYINVVPTGTTRSFANIDANIWGAEAGGQLSLPFDLYLKATLSYTEGRNKTDHRPLSEMPPLKGVLALRYDVDAWFLEVAENAAARRDEVDAALGEASSAGWATTDLKGGFRLGAFSLSAGVYNLFDRFYYTHLSFQRDPFASGVKVPENGRNYYVTAAYKF